MRVVTLTPEQRRATQLGDGAHLLKAPPGSGKTEVLVRRVIRLLEESEGQTFRILALTYTVRAAGELQDRINAAVHEDEQWRVNARTFHSFALDLLQNYGDAIGLSRPINVLSDAQDKRILLTEFLDANGHTDEAARLPAANDPQWRAAFSEIARRKTDLDPPRPNEREHSLGMLSFHDTYFAYENALTNSGSVDYEGMITQALALLQTDPWVGKHLRRQYRHVLVDEGQELTRGQYQLLKEVCSGGGVNIFVVADAEQSINTFAGGGPAFLDDFAIDFGARPFSLNTDFRSAESIRAILQSLRGYFPNVKRECPTLPKNTPLAGGWVEARSYPTEESEAMAISEWIIRLLKEGLVPGWTHEGESTDLDHEDVCVLGRNRYILKPVITELQERDVPVVISTERGDLFESPLGRSIYFLLQLIRNPRDFPARAGLWKEMGDIPPQSNAGEYFDDLDTALGQLADRGILPRGFLEDLMGLSAASSNGLDIVTSLLDLDGEWDADGGNGWYRDRELLSRSLQEYRVCTAPAQYSLSGFLGRLASMEHGPLTELGVRALTPHRARGLAFKAVVVAGMNEGTLPDYRAKTDKELDEERRVAYVAASRASRALLLTRPRERLSRYGKPYPCQESRFIQEMGLTMENLR